MTSLFTIFHPSKQKMRKRALTSALVWTLVSVALPVGVVGVVVMNGATWKENVQHGQFYFLAQALLSATLGAELLIPAKTEVGKIYRVVVFIVVALCFVGYFTATRDASVTSDDRLVASTVVLLPDPSIRASLWMVALAAVFGFMTAFRQTYCNHE